MTGLPGQQSKLSSSLFKAGPLNGPALKKHYARIINGWTGSNSTVGERIGGVTRIPQWAKELKVLMQLRIG